MRGGPLASDPSGRTSVGRDTPHEPATLKHCGGCGAHSDNDCEQGAQLDDALGREPAHPRSALQAWAFTIARRAGGLRPEPDDRTFGGRMHANRFYTTSDYSQLM